MAKYVFKLRDHDGNSVFTMGMEKTFLYLEYSDEVNHPGHANFITADGWWTPTIESIRREFGVRDLDDRLDYIFEIWREPRRVDWRSVGKLERVKQFLLRANRGERLIDSRPRTTPVFRDQIDLLDRPLVAPYGDRPEIHNVDGTVIPPVNIDPVDENYNGLNPGDTAFQMHEMYDHVVAYYPTPLLGIVNGVPALPNGSAGIVNHRVAIRWKNFLKVLQDMSDASWYAWFYGLSPNLPVDFSLQPAGGISGLPWTFTTHVGGLGTDRRINNPVGNPHLLLAVEYNNIAQPVYNVTRTEERNSIILAGDGDGVGRDIINVINNAHTGHSPWNERMLYMQDSTAPFLPAGLESLRNNGWSGLRDNAFREELSVILVQRWGALWPDDIRVGDLITASYDGAQQDYQVTKVKVQVFNHASSGESFEKVDIELSPPDGRRNNNNGQRSFQDILDQIKKDNEEMREELVDASNK